VSRASPSRAGPATRYAVLWHTGVAVPHFDVLVEPSPGANLAAWRSPVWPVEESVRVQRLPDHRRLYLDYEGEVGGHRGRVERAAGGTCQVEVGPEGVWTVTLLGGGVGTLHLRSIDGEQWELSGRGDASPSGL
jgi:hypothetical protein